MLDSLEFDIMKIINNYERQIMELKNFPITLEKMNDTEELLACIRRFKAQVNSILDDIELED